MLEEILRYLRNRHFSIGRIEGTFEIKDGTLELPILEGQYFQIEDSILNDGVYCYPATELKDETFTGAVIALAIPKAILNKLPEVEHYAKWRSAMMENGVFASESYGGYSYSLQSGADGTIPTWQAQFKDFFKEWKQI